MANASSCTQMENPADDPREFSGAAGDFNDPFSGGDGGDNMLCAYFSDFVV